MPLPDADHSAELLGEELHPVADPEDVDPPLLDEFEESVGEGGGAVGVDGVGPAGEDDDGGVEGGDGRKGGGAGDAEGEDGEAPDPAGDEVGVLRSEVEDEDKVALFAAVAGGGDVVGEGGGGVHLCSFPSLC